MSATHRQLIAPIVESDKQAIIRLKDLLNAECEALKARKHDELPAIIEAKTLALSLLEQGSDKRAKILQASNLAETQEAWEQLLESLGDKSLSEDWQQLQEDFEHCQRLNTVNGKLISRGRNTLGHLVNLMRGQVAAPELYNQLGGKDKGAGTHTVVEA